MRAVAEQLRYERRVLLEVDALDRRVRGRARPVGDHEREPVRELELRRPGAAAVADAAVDEHDARAASDRPDVHELEHTK